MTVKEQIEMINYMSYDILKLFASSFPTNAIIPLDKTRFGKWCYDSGAETKGIKAVKELFLPLICEATDGYVSICNTSSIYSFSSFIIKVDYKKKQEIVIESSGNKIVKWKVVGSTNYSGLYIQRYRTVLANNTESAINQALYSMNYDNKCVHEYVSIVRV